MLRKLWRSRVSGDEGFSMILVIGFTMVLMILSGLVLTLSIQSNKSGQQHQSFDLAIDSAEAGIDQMLGRLTVNHSYTLGSPVPTTGFPACPAGMTGTPEQCWAKQQIQTLAASNPALIQRGPTGDYLAIRPVNRQTVYAMGWAPSYAAAVNKKARMLKSEYLFAPYRPVDAILTSGSVDLSGSVLVDSPSGTPSSVHSNGNITSLPSDHIAGPVTASGTYDGRASVTNDPSGLTGSNAPLETIPRVDPRTTYTQLAADPNYTSNWYDLCPDGSVHKPDVTNFIPCQGPTLSSSGPYRGWEFHAAGDHTCVAKSDIANSGAACWIMTTNNSPYVGVYYAYQSDAIIGDGGRSSSPWNATVIAEAASSGGSPANCGKLGGNIDWKLNDINAYVSGLVLEAGADLYDSANNNAGPGMFVAADQVHFHTSSATLTGAVLAGDSCIGSPADSNEIQGVTIHFDETGEAPITSIVNTTLWLEYVG